MDAATFEIVDYVQYRAVLTQAIANDAPLFRPVYSARALYGLPDLSPASWSALIDRMAHNDTLFNVWHENFCTGCACAPTNLHRCVPSHFSFFRFVRLASNCKPPNAQRKKELLCRIRGTTPRDVTNCIANQRDEGVFAT